MDQNRITLPLYSNCFDNFEIIKVVLSFSFALALALIQIFKTQFAFAFPFKFLRIRTKIKTDFNKKIDRMGGELSFAFPMQFIIFFYG